jgi:glycosyltransferase involved in cell wall biosynthesis
MATGLAPHISVCIPCRDQGPYLAAAVGSVLAQGDDRVEIVVCDDGSAQPLGPALAAFAGASVRILRHESPRGAAAARNTCLAAARGRYIAFLDADDVLCPGALSRQVAALDQWPSAVLVHGGFQVLDEGGARLPDWDDLHPVDALTSGDEAFRELVLADFVTTSTVMVRRSALDRAGPFATDMGPSSTDWEMWLRLALLGDFAYLATLLAQYRQHPATISATTIRSGERLRSDVRAVRRVFARQHGRIPDRRRQLAHARAALAAKAVMAAGDAASRGDRRAAAGDAWLAVRAHPALALSPAAWTLVASHAMGDDYRAYRSGKAVLAHCARRVDGTRFARRMAKLVADDPAWQRQLERAAVAVRSCVPRSATVAVIDKWDPTVLHLAHRRGTHFPDRRLLPEGYPRHSQAAIDHLEALIAAGVDHLAVPSGAAWWLAHYTEFGRYLDHHYVKIHSGDDCVVYALTPQAKRKAG